MLAKSSQIHSSVKTPVTIPKCRDSSRVAIKSNPRDSPLASVFFCDKAKVRCFLTNSTFGDVAKRHQIDKKEIIKERLYIVNYNKISLEY